MGLSSCYVTEQGFRYLSLRSRAVPVARALADPHTSPAVRAFLERVQRIKAFAVAQFGLKQTKNYTSIVTLDSDRLATVVSACAPLSFDTYEWNYPLVGKLPYRGYFDPKEAAAEAKRLRTKGLDVITRSVDAFSTLGWLSDPLFSFMASYSEADVADTIIHEMTHATIWSHGHDRFNEELATFVGGEGSLIYLASVHGPGSPEEKKAREERADEDAFAAWLRGTAAELQTVYSSSLPPKEKLARKAQIIAQRAAAFKSQPATMFHDAGYRDFPMDKINNAYLDLYRLYEGEPELYKDYYEKICGSSLAIFVQKVSRIVKAGGDPKEAMRRVLAAAGPADVPPRAGW
ncbi:MAG TPA: aminopeptidase [Rectinemataceae bacterium]|nr:aminopeptidase [Rectinemataceae bacterium]